MGPQRSLMPRLRAAAVVLILGTGFASVASAEVAPIVDGVPFLIRFGGTVRGLKPGAPVEVRGIRIGEVTSVGVDYAPDSNGFVAPVAIVLQPSLFPAAGGHPRTAAEVYDAADALGAARAARSGFGHATAGRRRDRHARYPARRRAGDVGPERESAGTAGRADTAGEDRAAAPAADRQARQCADRSGVRRAAGTRWRR